jgi:hypothetical protein
VITYRWSYEAVLGTPKPCAGRELGQYEPARQLAEDTFTPHAPGAGRRPPRNPALSP